MISTLALYSVASVYFDVGFPDSSSGIRCSPGLSALFVVLVESTLFISHSCYDVLLVVVYR